MKSKTLALILLCCAASLGAKVKLPALVGDNMILQQQTEVKLWGTAAPKAEVRVTPSWNGQTTTCRADKDGRWLLAVKTPAAGYTPYEITFDDGEKTTLKNILIGEVWLASGQSNMEMPLKGFAGCCIMNGADDIIASAENRGVRMFTVPKHQTYEPQTDCKGSWNISSIETAPDFSATAYYFATSLSRALRIPVGIICSAYGGATVEGWISRELLENYPDISLNPDSIERLHPMHRPMLMYNAMLKPLQNYTIKGFIWYQGESNVGRHETYAERLAESWTAKGSEAWVSFDHLEMGICRNYDLRGFEVAGEDRVFHPADKVWLHWQTNEVVISSEKVPNPVAVRYCFRDFQVGTMIGGNELPTIPFRTDNW